ncbi:MAG: hypothetical protein ACRD4O_11605 [Bryobacteraceae bacterium]
MRNRGSIGRAILWMFVLSILLFWIPIIGPFIAGFVGGRKAGTVGNAIVAVFLPALVFAACLFFFASVLTGLPLLGFLAATGGLILVTAHVVPLLIGAIIGAIV